MPTIFGGGLGVLKTDPVNIEQKADAKPHTGRFYNIPKAYKKMAKMEVNLLCTIDVLEKLSHTEDSLCAAP